MRFERVKNLPAAKNVPAAHQHENPDKRVGRAEGGIDEELASDQAGAFESSRERAAPSRELSPREVTESGRRDHQPELVVDLKISPNDPLIIAPGRVASDVGEGARHVL